MGGLTNKLTHSIGNLIHSKFVKFSNSDICINNLGTHTPSANELIPIGAFDYCKGDTEKAKKYAKKMKSRKFYCFIKIRIKFLEKKGDCHK